MVLEVHEGVNGKKALLFSCEIGDVMLQILFKVEAASRPAHLAFGGVHVFGYTQCESWRIKIYNNFCQCFSISCLYIPLYRVLRGMN